MKKQSTGATRSNEDKIRAENHRRLQALKHPEAIATVALNYPQFALLEPAAKKNGVTTGEIILALAMEQLASTVPGEDGANRVMEALLWKYVRNGKTPTVPYEWRLAGFPTAADNLRIAGGAE